MMVAGSNYLQRWKQDRQSFHFSNLGSPWGWASWKRAWNYYDITMAAWGDHEIRARIRDVLADEEVFAFQSRRFDRLYGEPEDRHSWDLPWSFARLMQSGLTIVPAVNLVSNLGNRDGRGVPPTHPLAQLRAEPMPLPLKIPPYVAVDRLYDRAHTRRIYEWWETQDLPPSRAKRKYQQIDAIGRGLARALLPAGARSRLKRFLQARSQTR
jgi:hypothetical protein